MGKVNTKRGRVRPDKRMTKGELNRMNLDEYEQLALKDRIARDIVKFSGSFF